MRERNIEIRNQAAEALKSVDICAYCQRRGTERMDPDRKAWHIDHVFPFIKGGSDTLDNMVKACADCNSKKDINLWRPAKYVKVASGKLAEDSVATYVAKSKIRKPGWRPTEAGTTSFAKREQTRLKKAKATKPKVKVHWLDIEQPSDWSRVPPTVRSKRRH